MNDTDYQKKAEEHFINIAQNMIKKNSTANKPTTNSILDSDDFVPDETEIELKL